MGKKHRWITSLPDDGPDLEKAFVRGPKNFDGNRQKHVKLWFWAYADRFEAEDFVAMAESSRLDWVLVPMAGPV